ncbi:hypothetical protein V6Z11_D07G245600 [Gossypium hirsutum]
MMQGHREEKERREPMTSDVSFRYSRFQIV